ncbi:MAG: phage tail protein, partial [Blautia sp.]|nr:phage tail protein [Blautia sp.]
TKGVFIETSNNVEPVYFALLFEFDGDQHAIRHVLYNCTVSSRPTVESSTKEENIEPVTETLSISADPREDGLVKARTGDDTDETMYTGWYQAVYTPNVANG